MNIRFQQLSFVLFCVFLFGNCQEKKKVCTFSPIFKADMPTVRKHHFEMKEGAGIELVAFKNGMQLEIEQDGCPEAKQQFTFFMRGDFSKMNDEAWKLLAVQNFKFMAEASPELVVFDAWSEAIKAILPQIKLAQAAQVQDKKYVRIDKILSPEQALLVVQLSEQAQ